MFWVKLNNKTWHLNFVFNFSAKISMQVCFHFLQVLSQLLIFYDSIQVHFPRLNNESLHYKFNCCFFFTIVSPLTISSASLHRCKNEGTENSSRNTFSTIKNFSNFLPLIFVFQSIEFEKSNVLENFICSIIGKFVPIVRCKPNASTSLW